jgi:predicted RND superfamily exporter protein
MTIEGQKTDSQLKTEKYLEEITSIESRMRECEKELGALKTLVTDLAWKFNDKPGEMVALYDSIYQMLRAGDHMVYSAEEKIRTVANLQVKRLKQ